MAIVVVVVVWLTVADVVWCGLPRCLARAPCACARKWWRSQFQSHPCTQSHALKGAGTEIVPVVHASAARRHAPVLQKGTLPH